MSPSAIEVRAGGLEIRRFAFRVLVDVERMLAGRQALDIEFDFYAVRGFRENGTSDTLALRVFDFYGDRFWHGIAANRMHRKPPGESDKAHRTGNCFHGSLSVRIEVKA